MGIYRRFLVSVVLGLSYLVTLVSIAFAQTAQTREHNFTLPVNRNQSIVNFLQQAEDLASNVIEQEFTENSEVTEVSITILGDHNGQIVPLLTSKVSRSQWEQDPRIYRWTRYFNSAGGMLLGFYEQQTRPRSTGYNRSTPSTAAPMRGRPRRLELEDVPGFRDD